MTANRYVAVPTRLPGETGRQFVDRMLAQLSAQQTVAYRRTFSSSRIIESYAPGATRAAEMTVAVARRTQAKRVEALPSLGPQSH